MLKGASLWHLTCFWNWFSGLGSPQGVDVAFWLSRGHPSPALQSSPTDHTLAPFSNQMTERKGSKRIISQNLLAHLLSSMLLTLEMYKMCKNILGLCDVCVHAPPTHTRVPLVLHAMRAALPSGFSTLSGLSGLVSPTEVRPSFTGGICWCLELEFRFADTETDLLVVSKENMAFKWAAEDIVLVASGWLWVQLEAWEIKMLQRTYRDRKQIRGAQGLRLRRRRLIPRDTEYLDVRNICLDWGGGYLIV